MIFFIIPGCHISITDMHYENINVRSLLVLKTCFSYFFVYKYKNNKNDSMFHLKSCNSSEQLLVPLRNQILALDR